MLQQMGMRGVVKLLLACSEVQVDSKDKDGDTPLLCAARNGHEGVMKLLLACPKYRLTQRTMVHIHHCHMLLNGHEGVVKLLLACP